MRTNKNQNFFRLFISVSRQFTLREFTPKQFTPGQFTPGRFTPRYTLPFTIDLAIITRGELSLGRTIYPGNSPRNNSPRDNLPRDDSPGTIYPGTIHPALYFAFTIDLAIITRGELSLGRTIYPGNSPRNNSPRDNLPRDDSPGTIYPGTIHPALYFAFYYRSCDNNTG